MSDHDIYHEGERAAQGRAGTTESAQRSARMLADRIPSRALEFIEQLSLAAVGSRDRDGNVWATLLLGEPGFLRVADPYHLVLDAATADAFASDPLWTNLAGDPQLGLLLIDLGTRRRLRVNGRGSRADNGELGIDVERAYPNCPKYIQRRQLRVSAAPGPASDAGALTGERLDARQQAWIAGADTLFVASTHPRHGVDASHRGGRPGFVRVLSPSRLRVPDFVGNGLFNTLGNFTSYPHAGLAFIDFDRGRVLQLVGKPTVCWDSGGAESPAGDDTGGTRRHWELAIEAWRESRLAPRLTSRLLEFSPYLPGSER